MEIESVQIAALRFIYAANIVVAGIVGVLSLASPGRGGAAVFQNTVSDGPAVAVAGAFWIAITVLLVAGLVYPLSLGPVLLVQLVYKGAWLACFALPSWYSGRGNEVPAGIAIFFAIWVAVLPFVIPFGQVFR